MHAEGGAWSWYRLHRVEDLRNRPEERQCPVRILERQERFESFRALCNSPKIAFSYSGVRVK